MSSSDHENVGYRKPPREHRFSSENQPRRRKKRAARVQCHNLLANLLCVLGKDVSITLNGKPTKAKAGEVLVQQLVKQAIRGSFSEQLKFTTFLRDCGELDSEKMRNEIEEEYSQGLEEDQQRYSELLGLFKESVVICGELAPNLKLVSKAFIEVKSKCSCDAFDGHLAAEQASVECSQDDYYGVPDDDANEPSRDRERGWAPATRTEFDSEAHADKPAMAAQLDDDVRSAGLRDDEVPERPFIDDLSAGMIGND